MIVCVCSRVNTQQIQSAISISPTFDDVVLATGACKSCGLCRPEIERLITESTKCPNTGKNDVTTRCYPTSHDVPRGHGPKRKRITNTCVAYRYLSSSCVDRRFPLQIQFHISGGTTATAKYCEVKHK